MAPMKAAQISKAGGDFEIVEREIPKPGAGQVLIKVLACGACHSDVLTKEGLWPGIRSGVQITALSGASEAARTARGVCYRLS
jgi:D-arabinose 1-dehydrogenase-like Zn-dependent alcohol dehydrogenase